MRSPQKLLSLLAASVALAVVPARLPAQNDGVTHVDTVAAPSLRANLLGDPDRREVTVYLPPSYSKRPAKRYPVVYLLHGFAADHRAFMRGAYQNLNIRLSMDSLIRAGAVREMIVVTPNARDAYDGSFYANSVVTGNWEDFIVRDLVSYVDRKYRTVRNRTGRGLAGHSMGGFGALRVAMRHPEMFSALYALSPCCLGSLADSPDAGMTRAWKIALGLTDRSQFSKAGFIPNIIYGMAAVYSPDPANPPFYVRFPLALEGDSLISNAALATSWTVTPLTLVPAHVAGLARMAIAFDAGTADGFRDIPANVQKLDSLMTALGIHHAAELYEGTHGSRIRSRIESKVMPFFSRTLH
ncbi:MAG: alpha/beta hydrolase-fold protein [Gemmatimonadaceae bacterium]|nr:alpha/beta hydrolase-fold protein [Gemmatimonadaceae bacterium]